MAEDIFGRANSGLGGAFFSARAYITIAGGGLANSLLLTQIAANYRQDIQRINELESDKAYLVVGRPTGDGSAQAVFGPKPGGGAPYKELADPCSQHNISFQNNDATCSKGGGFDRTLHNVVMNSLQFQVNAQDMLIQEQIGFTFIYMSAG